MRCLFLLLAVTVAVSSFAQKGVIRGNVYDRDSGEPIAFGTVVIAGTTIGEVTDFDGFFTFSGLEAGSYDLETTYVGYDTARVEVELGGDGIEYVKLLIGEGVTLGAVEVTAGRTQERAPRCRSRSVAHGARY